MEVKGFDSREKVKGLLLPDIRPVLSIDTTRCALLSLALFGLRRRHYIGIGRGDNWVHRDIRRDDIGKYSYEQLYLSTPFAGI